MRSMRSGSDPVRPGSLWSVVLNWKNDELTARCVTELLNSTYEPHSIVVVDNGSEDGSAARLRARFPSCTILENSQNIGFSRGCNVGIRHALMHGAQYVGLVNNDLILDRHAYSAAVGRLDSGERTGAVTGKIFMEDGRTIWQAGGRISHRRVMGLAVGNGCQDGPQFDVSGDTGWASGAMSVFRGDILERLGLLPEEYFFGQEEWDISTNLLRSGHLIAYEPKYIGFHSHGGSYARHPVLNGYGGTRNRLLYSEKYLSRGWRAMWAWAFRLHIFVAMPLKLRLRSGVVPERGLYLKAMKLAFVRHRPGQAVTLEELRVVTAELGAPDTWEPARGPD